MSEFTSLIASILPYALGAAVSPLLFTNMLDIFPPMKNPRLPLLSFFLGSILFFILLIIAGMFLGSNLSATILGPINTGALLEVFLGGILILIAFKILFVNEEPREGGFFGFIKGLREDNTFSIFIKFLYFGIIILLASFTTSLLIFSAGTIIGLANPTFWIATAAIVVFGIIAFFLIEIPFLVYLIRPRVPGGILSSLNSWLGRYGNDLLSLVMLLLGIFFIIRGSLVLY